MIDKLIPEQEAMIPAYRQEWIDKLKENRKIDRPKCVEGINWLYEFSSLPKPHIVFVNSPLAAQVVVNAAEVYETINKEVKYSSNEYQSPNNLKTESIVELKIKLAESALDTLDFKEVSKKKVEESLKERIRKDSLSFFRFASYGNIFDYGWLAFYSFFEKIGTKITNENFFKFRDLVETGLYDMIQMEGLCVVCEMPSLLRRDEEGALHSLTSPAIAWEDGYEVYSLWGVRMKKDLWSSIVNKKITALDALKIENMEQRMVALKVFGPEALLSDIGGKLLNVGRKGASLYEVTKVFPQTEYFVKYSCPSTGRVYVDCVDPTAGQSGDADIAMAWKQGLSKEQYLNQMAES